MQHRYHRDGGLPVWLQFLLGTAGLTVTVLAVIAFEHAGEKRPQAEIAEIISAPPQARPRRELNAADKRQLAAIRRQREASAIEAGARCVGGTLFAEIDGALTNVGTCHQ